MPKRGVYDMVPASQTTITLGGNLVRSQSGAGRGSAVRGSAGRGSAGRGSARRGAAGRGTVSASQMTLTLGGNLVRSQSNVGRGSAGRGSAENERQLLSSAAQQQSDNAAAVNQEGQEDALREVAVRKLERKAQYRQEKEQQNWENASIERERQKQMDNHTRAALEERKKGLRDLTEGHEVKPS